jgi:hypothetical protein
VRTFKQFAEAKVPKPNFIHKGHPVRAAASDIPTYWEDPSQAISLVEEILDQHGFKISDVVSFDDKLADYRASYHLVENSVGVDSELVFVWHLMDSGRYEVTASLS